MRDEVKMHLWSYGFKANDREETTKRHCIEIFKKAKRTIRIVGGDLNSEFYGNSEVLGALREASTKKKVLIEIAYYPGEGAKNGTKRELFQVPGIRVFHLSRPADRHFMVVDGKHVRIEQRHEPGAKLTMAATYHGTSRLGAEGDRRFKALAKELVIPR